MACPSRQAILTISTGGFANDGEPLHEIVLKNDTMKAMSKTTKIYALPFILNLSQKKYRLCPKVSVNCPSSFIQFSPLSPILQ